MREVKTQDESGQIIINRSTELYSPVFAVREGKVAGMIVKEEKGWILRIGGSGRSHRHCSTLYDCIKGGRPCGYNFFIDISLQR
jgi:hypothetical protein